MPHMIRSLTFIWTFLVAISIFLISRPTPPSMIEQIFDDDFSDAEKAGNLSTTNTSSQSKQSVNDAQLKSVAHCFYSIRYWQYFSLMAMGVYGCVLVSYSYKPFGTSGMTHEPISDELLTWAASIGAGLVNGMMRLIFGKLIDKHSARTLLSILLSAELIMCIVFYWAAHSPALYFLCIMVDYAILGGFFTIIPVSITKVFGLEIGPQVYVHVTIGSFFSAFLNLLATRLILPHTSYQFIYMLGAIFTTFALIILFFIKEELDVDNLRRRGALKSEPLNNDKFVLVK